MGIQEKLNGHASRVPRARELSLGGRKSSIRDTDSEPDINKRRTRKQNRDALNCVLQFNREWDSVTVDVVG